ncbi:bifunctional diaminohydroxyphosphoribosylaminopyrimidine deaminase/5-amino-6-(5-phosphoribosylamino)uracil reductase RibD [soil metagenome]
MVARDAFYMSQALALAERGRGRTSPNPMVGAVVVDGEGVVVGRGLHHVAGGPHAEVYALQDAGERARGSTLYCTLEPCCHTGRTGPCAPLVVRAGIARAVIAVGDPNPLVAGRGLAHLRAHGVDVTVGVLAHAAERLNGPFFTVIRRRRPLVTLKVALSLDRKVAAGPGQRTPLTGAAANRLIHRDRAEVDAIAVGSGTVRADDPLLTARGAFRARPLTRVVFDRSLRTPPAARLLSTLEAGPVVFVCTALPDPDRRLRREALRAAGAIVEVVDAAGGQFLEEALSRMVARGVTSLVLEGGPTVHRAAWQAGVVDRLQVFTTPRRLGPEGVPWLAESELRLADLVDVRIVRLGEDLMTEGYVHGTG